MCKILENTIQETILRWCQNNNFYTSLVDFDSNKKYNGIVFSVPNGGKRNKLEAKKMKEQGLLAGVSDLIIIMYNKIFFLELKNSTGKQSEKQKAFQYILSLLGFDCYYLPRSSKEAVDIIKNYLT